MLSLETFELLRVLPVIETNRNLEGKIDDYKLE